jgi:sugar phosphate isomerase/epimerase
MEIGFFSPEIEGDDVLSVFEQGSRLGFTRVQYSFASSHGEEMPARFFPDELDKIREASQRFHINITAINGTFNMIDPDKARRREYIDRFERIAEACGQLNCNIITLCTGSRHPESGWIYHPDTAKDDAWEDLMDTTRRLIPIAEKYDVYLGVETEASNVIFTADRARRYLDETGSNRLKVIMDCANLFPAGTAAKENMRPAIRRAFDFLGKDIILAHGKDICASDSVSFAAPGRGIVDYDFYFSLLRQYRYDNCLILHGIHDPADFAFSVPFLKKKLEQAGL